MGTLKFVLYKKGFTLIEILVVVAIISVLSSVVLVGLLAVREKARLVAGQEMNANIFHTVGDMVAGYWNFDGNLQDSSGSNNNGSGAVTGYLQGMSGQAVSLNQTSINVGHSTLFDTPDFTFSFWLEQVTIQSGGVWNNIILGREVYLTKGFRMGINSDGTVQFWTTQSGGTLTLQSITKIQTGKFYHVAVTYSSATQEARMYIDGHEAARSTGSYSPAVGVDLSVNGGPGGTGSSNSIFDDMHWYSKALTAI